VFGAVQPVDCLTVKLQYNDFTADQSVGVSSDLAQELDLTASYKYSANVTFMLGFGYVWPGDFMDEWFGNDNNDDATLLDFRTVVTF
jgi:hypothetical protein